MIYLAGPLFSEAERRFNAELTDRLEEAGFAVFLPQRDGVEGDRPPYDTMPREERRRAMFALDVEQVVACDDFVIVLDGRVPDEGACFELGVAYAEKRFRQPAKRLLGVQTDVRAAFLGAKLNPMISLALDGVVASGEELVARLGSAWQHPPG